MAYQRIYHIHADHLFVLLRFTNRVRGGRLECIVDGCNFSYRCIVNASGAQDWEEVISGEYRPDLSWNGYCRCALPNPDDRSFNLGDSVTWQCPACEAKWKIVIIESPGYMITKWVRVWSKPKRPLTIFDEIGAGDLFDS